MLPPMGGAPIYHLADVEPVLEQMGERSYAEPDTAPYTAISKTVGLGPDATAVEVLDQGPHRAKLQIAGEDSADHLRLLGHHDQLLVDNPIAERYRSPDPDALALGGGDLVAHPFADHLAFELGKGKQYIKCQP